MDERIQELLVQWELAREGGQQVTAEQLCADAPELTEVLSRHIELLRASQWMLDDPVAVEPISNSEDTDSVASETVQGFVKSLADSGVLESSRLLSVDEQASRCTSVNELADALVRDGVITAYQADVLIQHDNRPLILDRYVVLDRLGSGGMGVVYKALHRAMERIVAIKVLPDDALDSPEKVSRFQREIRSVAKLSHPHVVSAYDAHEQDNVHFLVMECIDGKNSQEMVCDSGPLPVDDAVRLIDQVASGLAAAHQLGMVHRDVKPNNIMVDREGTAKLLDLGLSRADISQGSRPQSELTQEGAAMGTASYMSPEQALDSASVDARSDIYSLGCTLFYLLTGKVVFEKTTTVQTIVAHREDEAPKLSQFRDDVPKSVEVVYQRMVEKEPDDRYASIEYLRRDLAAITSGSSVSRPAKRRKSERRSVRLFAATLAATLLIGAVVAGAMLMVGQPKSATQFSQRDLAKWALASDGFVTIDSAMGKQEIIDSTEIPDADFQVIGLELTAWEASDSAAPALACVGLRRLSLANYADVDVQSIVAMNSLTNLELIECQTSDDDAKAISEMKQLTQLSILYGELSDQGLMALSSLPHVKSLDLSGAKTSGSGWQHLGAMPSLRRLTLSEAAIQDAELGLLPSDLKRLNLSYCEIGDAAVEHIIKQSELTDLDLAETNVTDVGVTKLRELRKLQHLDLGGLSLNPSSIASLADLPELNSLALVGVVLDDAMLSAIAELDKIRVLDLSSTGIENGDLMKLFSMSSLELLDISNTLVTNRGAERFEQKRPDVAVYLE